jgi:Domain of unknown function (DUF4386)
VVDRQADTVGAETGSGVDRENAIRTAGRRLLAAVIVIGPLTQVIAVLVLPWIGADDYVSAVRASSDAYPAYAWLSLAGALTLAPAATGVGLAVWRTRPGWALAGLILTVPGLLNPDGNPEDLIYAAHGANVPAQTTRTMLDQLGNLPASGPVGFYAFAVAFAVGGVVLGIGVIRSDSAPRWAGAGLVIAGLGGVAGSFIELGPVVIGGVWTLVLVSFTACAIRTARAASPIRTGTTSAPVGSPGVGPSTGLPDAP